MNLTTSLEISKLTELSAASAKGRYPAHTRTPSMKAMHKVLKVRGWAFGGGKYSHGDRPNHSVTMDANGSWTYTHPKGNKSGHTVADLKTCMDSMGGIKY
jgi:hypothetical protein